MSLDVRVEQAGRCAPLRCWCAAGKGMHSRLYTRVLNKHAWMHNCTAFNSLYNDTGIAGVFASAESAHAEEAVDVLTREMLVCAAVHCDPSVRERLTKVDVRVHVVWSHRKFSAEAATEPAG